jgi:hypothetical protein
MRLKQEEPGKLTFAGRLPVLPPIWVGIALLVGPASLALFAPGAVTTPRLVTALLIGGLGLGLIFRSWPRVMTLAVDTQARLVIDGASRTAFTEAATYHLVAVAPRTPGGRPVYGVALHPHEGDAHRLLVATTDPADALTDLTRMQAHLRLPVRGGWGLPTGAPWVDTGSGARPQGEDAVAEERAGRRRASTAMMIGSVAISLGIARTVHQRVALGQYPEALSIVLPALGVTIMFVLAIAIATSHSKLHLAGDLVSERRLFGFSLARRTVPRAAIRAAYLVSPDGGAPRHLLVDTTDGPRAFLYNGDRPGDVGSLLSR